LRSFVLVAFLEAKRHTSSRRSAADSTRCRRWPLLLMCHRYRYCLLLLLQLLLLLLPVIAARSRHGSASKRPSHPFSARFVPSGWGDLMLPQRRR
jgi:hypothetical protein